jgi:hypothetical protein
MAALTGIAEYWVFSPTLATNSNHLRPTRRGKALWLTRFFTQATPDRAGRFRRPADA